LLLLKEEWLVAPLYRGIGGEAAGDDSLEGELFSLGLWELGESAL